LSAEFWQKAQTVCQNLTKCTKLTKWLTKNAVFDKNNQNLNKIVAFCDKTSTKHVFGLPFLKQKHLAICWFKLCFHGKPTSEIFYVISIYIAFECVGYITNIIKQSTKWNEWTRHYFEQLLQKNVHCLLYKLISNYSSNNLII